MFFSKSAETEVFQCVFETCNRGGRLGGWQGHFWKMSISKQVFFHGWRPSDMGKNTRSVTDIVIYRPF